MVGPFVIRVLTLSVDTVGGNVGRLTALSTFGSFIGTLLIGYLLIPFLRNSVTMFLTAALLMLVAAGYFLFWKRAGGAAALTALAVAAGLGSGYYGLRQDRLRSESTIELYRANSNFGQLQVLQNKNSPLRLYLNDYLTQNTYDTNELKSISMFTYMLHGLAQAYTPRIDEVLCIGLGVGIVPMEFARDGAKVDVVEINPAVVPLAEKFFGLQPTQLNISIGGGRCFVNRCAKQYDSIILDAFLGDSSPSHLMTREAFTAMRRSLKPEGTLVINTFGDFDPGQDFLAASLSKTLASVFPSVRIHHARYGNTLFVASSRTNLAIVHPPTFDQVHRRCADEVEEAFETLRETDPRHGMVLTDDFNPVEFYDARNRESMRRYLANAMHEP
jgi:spermidine synthase